MKCPIWRFCLQKKIYETNSHETDAPGSVSKPARGSSSLIGCPIHSALCYIEAETDIRRWENICFRFYPALLASIWSFFWFKTKCLHNNLFISLVGRVSTNGQGNWGSILGRVIPETQKMVMDNTLLNIQHYKVHIKGKVEQSRERNSTLLYNLV